MSVFCALLLLITLAKEVDFCLFLRVCLQDYSIGYWWICLGTETVD